jgi:hypothetical protein
MFWDFYRSVFVLLTLLPVGLSAVESFSVSDGGFSAPYFNFTDSGGKTPDFSTQLLYRGETYQFNATGISTSHSFMIGESYGDTSSSLVSGGSLTGSSGSITVTIPTDFSCSFYYYCTNYAGMIQELTVVTPSPFASYFFKAIAYDKSSNNHFGRKVSLNDNLLPVGAHDTTPNAIRDAGSVYIFPYEHNGTITYLNKISAPGKPSGDRFGTEVSSSKALFAVLLVCA